MVELQETNCQRFRSRRTLFNVFSSCQKIFSWFPLVFLFLCTHTHTHAHWVASRIHICLSLSVLYLSYTPIHTRGKTQSHRRVFLCNNNTVNTDAACDAGPCLYLFHAASPEDRWRDWAITLWLVSLKFLNWTQVWVSWLRYSIIMITASPPAPIS